VGKRADFMLLNPKEFTPYHDAYAALVFAAGVENIHSLYVDGVQVRQRDTDARRLNACLSPAPGGLRQTESAPPAPPAG
jgi:cytosine/adenosine deaminase-related metal-dependent hydrolase